MRKKNLMGLPLSMSNETYKINIAILDMNTLIGASFYCAQNKTYYDVSEFIGKRGVIRFENI